MPAQLQVEPTGVPPTGVVTGVSPGLPPILPPTAKDLLTVAQQKVAALATANAGNAPLLASLTDIGVTLAAAQTALALQATQQPPSTPPAKAPPAQPPATGVYVSGAAAAGIALATGAVGALGGYYAGRRRR